MIKILSASLKHCTSFVVICCLVKSVTFACAIRCYFFCGEITFPNSRRVFVHYNANALVKTSLTLRISINVIELLYIGPLCALIVGFFNVHLFWSLNCVSHEFLTLCTPTCSLITCRYYLMKFLPALNCGAPISQLSLPPQQRPCTHTSIIF